MKILLYEHSFLINQNFIKLIENLSKKFYTRSSKSSIDIATNQTNSKKVPNKRKKNNELPNLSTKRQKLESIPTTQSCHSLSGFSPTSTAITEQPSSDHNYHRTGENERIGLDDLYSKLKNSNEKSEENERYQ
jgi:hypothetical protein